MQVLTNYRTWSPPNDYGNGSPGLEVKGNRTFDAPEGTQIVDVNVTMIGNGDHDVFVSNNVTSFTVSVRAAESYDGYQGMPPDEWQRFPYYGQSWVRVNTVIADVVEIDDPDAGPPGGEAPQFILSHYVHPDGRIELHWNHQILGAVEFEIYERESPNQVPSGSPTTATQSFRGPFGNSRDEYEYWVVAVMPDGSRIESTHAVIPYPAS